MTFKEKVKTFVSNWMFVYNFFFRPWVIKRVITETLTGLERQNYENQIRHQKMIVSAQVLEFKNVIAERDALWMRLQEAREGISTWHNESDEAFKARMAIHDPTDPTTIEDLLGANYKK